jgi:hypothetical protein
LRKCAAAGSRTTVDRIRVKDDHRVQSHLAFTINPAAERFLRTHIYLGQMVTWLDGNRKRREDVQDQRSGKQIFGSYVKRSDRVLAEHRGSNHQLASDIHLPSQQTFQAHVSGISQWKFQQASDINLDARATGNSGVQAPDALVGIWGAGWWPDPHRTAGSKPGSLTTGSDCILLKKRSMNCDLRPDSNGDGTTVHGLTVQRCIRTK